MSEVEDLLSLEGVEDAETLLEWAKERAANLLLELDDDAELAPLLQSGGHAGDAPLRAVPDPQPAPRREPSNAAPLPPIPTAAAPPERDEEELDEDEIEELDVEELELIEELEDEDEDEDTDRPPGPPSATPEDPADETPADETPSETPADETPSASFGPPDGTEVVPEWKAALMSTQTETDEEAAERVKEASTAGPLPVMPDEAPPPFSGRLEAEDDEISQHSVDLSDLDTDDD